MISNDHNSTLTEILSQWIKFPLKRLEGKVKYSPTVLIDHYLIVIVYEGKSNRDESDDFSDYDEKAVLLAVNLWDHSIQEAQIPESMFKREVDYTLTKFKDNQIIKFGGKKYGWPHGGVVKITIESFERTFYFLPCLITIPTALSVKCVEIKDHYEDDNPRRGGSTAQIYKDHLYVFGGTDDTNDQKNELWSFDLNNLTWKLCETTGEGPKGRYMPNSSVIGDNLFVYGGEGYETDKDKTKDIFVLNLNSLSWTRIEQEKKYLLLRSSNYGANYNGHVYKDHLLIIAKDKKKGSKSKGDMICCWNPDAKSWSKFYAESKGIPGKTTNVAVYKNLLIVVGQDNDQLLMATLNLEGLGLMTPKSFRQKRLFMSEEGSDISFKIGDQIIPAHKKILIHRSLYFANLFKSGMIESRQQIIEMNDCEYNVFQEFLRFLYYEEAQLEDIYFAFKLLGFSDKYLQNDLHERCMDFLTFGLNAKNVYTILDFALQQGIAQLEGCCLKFLKNNLTVDSVSELIQYLDEKSTFDLELKDSAFNFIIAHAREIFQEENMIAKFCEEFLIKNITMETIVKIVNFMYDSKAKIKNRKEIPQENIINLRKACFNFAKKNFKRLHEKNIPEKLPNAFLSDVILYMVETQKQPENSL